MAHQYTIADLSEILFRHKFKIVLIPLFVGLMTVGLIIFFPRTYRSEARLFLQLGRESVAIDPTATTGPSTALIQNNRDEEVKSALQVIGSRGIISQVVDRLGADYIHHGSPSESKEVNPVVESLKNAVGSAIGVLKLIDPISAREDAIIEIEKSFSVEAERNSMVLTASFDAASPEAAQKILDTMVEVYQAEHLRIHRNADSGAFLAEQRDLLKVQFAAAQEKLKEAKKTFGIASLNGRRSNLEAQLQSIELSQIQTRQELTATEAKIKDIESQLSSIPERELSSEKSIPNEGADLLRKELYTNQMTLMQLKSRLIDNHPLVVATSRQVEEGKRVLDEQGGQRQETVEDINPIYRALNLDRRQQESVLAGLTARAASLDAQHAQLRTELEEFGQHEIELVQLEQDEQIARDKYLQYTNNLEQSRVDEALEKGNISSVSIAQSATLAEKPVSPSKVLVLLGGAFMALASVVGTIFVSEKLNDKIRSERDLAKSVGLPVLAVLDENKVNRRILVR
jgi:polysaccharide biosynthesis protein PslE